MGRAIPGGGSRGARGSFASTADESDADCRRGRQGGAGGAAAASDVGPEEAPQPRLASAREAGTEYRQFDFETVWAGQCAAPAPPSAPECAAGRRTRAAKCAMDD